MKSRKNRTPGNPADDRKRNDALNKHAADPGEAKLPGEYPAQEDIMNRKNTQRVGIDVENFSRAIGTENLNVNEPVVTDPNSIDEDPLSRQRDLEDRRDGRGMEYPIPKDIDDDETAGGQDVNESDVTEEDLQVGVDAQLRVLSHFRTLVPGQRPA